ncbi:hypothetical protein PGT21_024899 [Puccinia graminis f. sp. tritici]|uniref:Uncharacterized protein n=1 Tax=Puccinia graminis f. sp. tritici TaxID=56615 RepID=A0A5B0MX96_PUCGR|nr:hypothetical protein PGT21_024899 [Puccinia graminis f. sp. tritici]
MHLRAYLGGTSEFPSTHFPHFLKLLGTRPDTPRPGKTEGRPSRAVTCRHAMSPVTEDWPHVKRINASAQELTTMSNDEDKRTIKSPM